MSMMVASHWWEERERMARDEENAFSRKEA